MNMKQLELTLIELALYDDTAFVLGEALRHKLERCVKYVQSRQRSAKRRSAHFKFLADEQREMLR